MELVCPLPCATATIANQVQSDLTLIQSLIANYKSATAAEQPGIVQKISAALGVAVTTVAAIASLLPAAPGAVRASNPVKAPSARELKKQFNAIFAANGFPQAEIK